MLTRKQQVESIKAESDDYPELLDILWAIQSGQYKFDDLIPVAELRPEQYPLAINEQNVLLTPTQQGVINKIVTTKRGHYMTYEDISDSFFRDTIVRKAYAIAKARFKKAEDYFITRQYRKVLRNECSEIFLYTPIIVTNNNLPDHYYPSVNIDDAVFQQVKADFLTQYHKVSRILEGFESYRQELSFFEKEPSYFQDVVIRIQGIKKELSADTKQKKALVKQLGVIEAEANALIIQHREISKTTKKVGRFILDTKQARLLKGMEDRIATLQNDIAEINKQLADLTEAKSIRTTSLRTIREERTKHTNARKEIDALIANGVVVPSPDGEIAPWNTPTVNEQRHKLFNMAVYLIAVFEAECKKLKLKVPQTEIMNFDQFLTKYVRYSQNELGTIIVSNSITSGQGIFCGFYGKRTLQIIPSPLANSTNEKDQFK